MPVMDVYTTTGEIRKWERENKKDSTQVIALTAHALKEDRQKCLDAGCTDYLSKPIKKEGLLGKIIEVLSFQVIPLFSWIFLRGPKSSGAY